MEEFDGETLTLNNLSKLNEFGNHGKDIFLTANDDPATYPDWLHGNPVAHKGDSSAKMPVIFVRKSIPGRNGEPIMTVDMFSFYFFNFNAWPRLSEKASIRPPCHKDFLAAASEIRQLTKLTKVI